MNKSLLIYNVIQSVAVDKPQSLKRGIRSAKKVKLIPFQSSSQSTHCVSVMFSLPNSDVKL